ncbi:MULTISPECIES: hypothetical protein [Rhodococcus]|uniref:hypothetical protein n=1 Tax=Rhodococcus TaxID=1827 RepID=UPI00295432A8|nr:MULTISPECIES: hypothetical protein [Rhodococcus]MDV7246713.1 hypothetical protein [Rhodococcus oxybenzonivorans]MDV7337726.1 hypothetical protein [Rhodococcus oxybenzonivorans]MDV7347782.1 hypothetical protein [Rhodococcus oxybenzonivorans]MDV8031490.1 hypothetical protein [Rhodococcus sp. IEGM 27]
MSPRPIIDAGPALNFLAINRERILTGVLGRISTPETVETEVLEKAKRDPRFRTVSGVWAKMRPGWIELLSDDQTPELAAVVQRLSQLPMAERKMTAKDLGETMVVAHAVVKAESGQKVIIIIDDQGGAALAMAEKRRLDRIRDQGKSVGSITLVNTVSILRKAAGGVHVPDRKTMREIYTKLRACDDGLLPIEQTSLLAPDLWL